MSERIDLSERLFNLTCALLVAKNGLSKQEIFSSVQGYKEKFDSSGDNESLNRLFERDKTLLTRSGVKWRAFIPKESMDDNQDYRYTILNEDFRWPEGVSLSSKQVALMNLAAAVWAKTSLSTEANQGIQRIRALGESADSQTLIGIAPRIRTHDPAFSPLSVALETNSRVSFDYRKPNGELSVRNLEPWSLQNISGQWLLVAFDLNRDQPRNFLLRRIASEVDIQDVTFDPPTASEVGAVLAELRAFTDSQVARIRVTPGGAAWFHFGLSEGEDTVVQSYMDLQLLAVELMEFVGEIREVEPRELDERIRQTLLAVAQSHA